MNLPKKELKGAERDQLVYFFEQDIKESIGYDRRGYLVFAVIAFILLILFLICI